MRRDTESEDVPQTRGDGGVVDERRDGRRVGIDAAQLAVAKREMDLAVASLSDEVAPEDGVGVELLALARARKAGLIGGARREVEAERLLAVEPFGEAPPVLDASE